MFLRSMIAVGAIAAFAQGAHAQVRPPSAPTIRVATVTTTRIATVSPNTQLLPLLNSVAAIYGRAQGFNAAKAGEAVDAVVTALHERKASHAEALSPKQKEAVDALLTLAAVAGSIDGSASGEAAAYIRRLKGFIAKGAAENVFAGPAEVQKVIDFAKEAAGANQSMNPSSFQAAVETAIQAHLTMPSDRSNPNSARRRLSGLNDELLDTGCI